MHAPAPSGLPGALLAMIDALSPAGAEEVERALAIRLWPSLSPGEQRVQMLGGLAQLLGEAAARGERLTRADYDAARNPDAPSSERLVADRGSWPAACRAATGLLPDGRHAGPGRPWRAIRPGEERVPAYSRDECIAAIRRCAAGVRRRPSSNVYFAWRLEECRRARRRGAPPPRLPGQGAIYRHFGSWPMALAAASITDAELRAMRPQGASATDDATTAIRALSDDDLALLVSHADGIRLLRQSGPLALRLSSAVRLAHGLDGSVDWLAGRTRERGVVASVDACQFDGAAFAAARRASGLSEKDVRERLGLALGPYRRLIGGALEPTLEDVASMASLVGSAIAHLLRS